MEQKIDRYQNIQTRIESGKLIIEIVIDERLVDVQPSKSGKTMVIATSGGAMRVPSIDLKLNLTLYRK